MKTFSQFITDPASAPSHEMTPMPGLPPALVTMTRQSVRSYPTVNVALYYAKQIDRYFTILYH